MSNTLGSYTRGTLEVIAGPMYAGKSSELLKRVLYLSHSGKKILVLKPHTDDRYAHDAIVTQNKLSHPAISVTDLELVKENYNITPYNFNTLFIDEIQFFETKETIWFIEEGLRNGVHFVVAGLDQDAGGVPFETTARLLALGDAITKLPAFCTKCGATATKTQRLNKNSERIAIGAFGDYEPRCHIHWQAI
jgi:thymidine kinase